MCMSNCSAFLGWRRSLGVHALRTITPHGNESHRSLQRSSPDESQARSGSSTAPPFLLQVPLASEHLPGKEPTNFCWMAPAVNQGTCPPLSRCHQPSFSRCSQVTAESLLLLTVSMREAAGPQLPRDGLSDSLRVPVLIWYFGTSHPRIYSVWPQMCGCIAEVLASK